MGNFHSSQHFFNTMPAVFSFVFCYSVTSTLSPEVTELARTHWAVRRQLDDPVSQPWASDCHSQWTHWWGCFLASHPGLAPKLWEHPKGCAWEAHGSLGLATLLPVTVSHSSHRCLGTGKLQRVPGEVWATRCSSIQLAPQPWVAFQMWKSTVPSVHLLSLWLYSSSSLEEPGAPQSTVACHRRVDDHLETWQISLSLWILLFPRVPSFSLLLWKVTKIAWLPSVCSNWLRFLPRLAGEGKYALHKEQPSVPGAERGPRFTIAEHLTRPTQLLY